MVGFWMYFEARVNSCMTWSACERKTGVKDGLDILAEQLEE